MSIARFSWERLLAVDEVVGARVAVLAAVQLHHRDAGEVLLQVLVQQGDAVADLAIEGPRDAAEHPGGERDHGDGQQQEPGELRRDAEHHHQRDQEGNQLAQQQSHSGEQLEEHLHVVRHAGHHPPDGHAVEEGGRPVLEVREEVLAQVAQCPEHRPREEDAMQVETSRPEDDERAVEGAARRQGRQVQGLPEPPGGERHPEGRCHDAALRDQDAVDHDAGDHDRSEHRQHRGGHDEEGRERGLRQVRLHPAKQPAQQAEVEGPAGELGVEYRVIALRRVHADSAGSRASSPASSSRARCSRRRWARSSDV